jgi:hypothetical protein
MHHIGSDTSSISNIPRLSEEKGPDGLRVYNSMDDKGMKQISKVRAGRIRDPDRNLESERIDITIPGLPEEAYPLDSGARSLPTVLKPAY